MRCICSLKQKATARSIKMKMVFWQFIFLFFAFLASGAEGQVGAQTSSAEAEIDANGPTNELTGLAADLVAANPKLSPQDAIDIVAVIESTRKDPETMLMVNRMKNGDGQDAYEKFTADLSPVEIVAGLKQGLDELKMLEILFKDKERALKVMTEDGMIDKKRLKDYKKNPDLLEEDTRKGLFFTFVSLAVAGGYL